MSKKSAKIETLIGSLRGGAYDAHYLGYFACFNRGWFYEAHDVLEELWLQDRQGPNGNFYKALIQFAGAFVHLQKHCERYPRLRPAAALFRLCSGYLAAYEPTCDGLDVAQVRSWADQWREQLERSDFERNPLGTQVAPRLELQGPAQ